MEDFFSDVGKFMAKTVETVEDEAKDLRNAAAKMIEVDEDEGKLSPKKKEPDDLEDPDKEQHMLDSMRHWDVKMPATRPKKTFGLKMPSFRRNFTKKRRITIELYKKGPAPGQDPNEPEYDRRVFQKLNPRASIMLGDDDGDLEDEIYPPLGEDDFIIFRILKQVKPKKGSAGGYEWDDDDSLASSHFSGAYESNKLITYNTEDYGDGKSQEALSTHWMERQRARIPTMDITEVNDLHIQINIGVGQAAIVRDFNFESQHDVDTFVKTFDKMQELMHARGTRMAAELRMQSKRTPRKSFVADQGGSQSTSTGLWSSVFGTSKTSERPLTDNTVNILVEIVSASNLPIADICSSDPYVEVEDGKRTWHTTEIIANTLNPVWTLSSGSLFVIQTNLTDFLSKAAHIEFIVKDHDSIGSNDVLASVLVSKNQLLNATGDRVEYELTTAKIEGKKNEFIGKKKSYLTIRAKPATEEEISFIELFKAKQVGGTLSKLNLTSNDVTGVYSADSSLPPRTHTNNTSYKRQSKADADGGPLKLRLKPFPHPDRPESTQWLTESEIEQESRKPSENWIEAGSGAVGKLYVEILGCDDLPNKDFSITGRAKSDPYVCMAFEDAVVNTDVINDCLSPRWMPWTRRAFVFNVMHPSSQFYVAVMDYDGGLKSTHDKLGRCVINPSNKRVNTVYTLRFNLVDKDETEQNVTGKISMRVRYECSNPREHLLSAFQMRKEYALSTNSYTESQAMAFAVTNDYDRYALSLFSIQKYADELSEYQLFLDDMVDGIKVVILWRGHFPLQFSSYSFKAPFHSMIAFTWAILLSINFDRFPSFICFVFAWILFATLEIQRKNPNPWKRPRTYIAMLSELILNKSYGGHEIKKNENIEVIMDYDDRRNERMVLRKEAIDRMTVQNEQDAARLAKEQAELDKQTHDHSADVTVGLTEIALSPFKAILDPIQRILFLLCVYLRVAKNILMWRDSVVAFWLSTIALSFSAITFFVPWTFLIRWAFRVGAIALFGPWMKLVDIFLMEHDDNLTKAERKAKLEKEMKERYEFLLSQSKIGRLIQEHEMKFNDMHRYLYGQYGHRVPVFKEERLAFVPLSGGFAVPHDPLDNPPANIVGRINGQVLEGDMIMKRQDQAKEFKELQKQKLMESQLPPIIIDTGSKDDEMEPLLEGNEESGGYGSLAEA